MSGHLVEEALKLGAIMVEDQTPQNNNIKRDWEITFELDGFTIKHGVNSTLEEMYDWILQLSGVFNIQSKKVVAKKAPTETPQVEETVQPNFENAEQYKYPNRNDADKIVGGLTCPFNEGKELSPSREDWARYNQEDGMLDNYYCTKDEATENCTRGADCGKTIWRRQAIQAV